MAALWVTWSTPVAIIIHRWRIPSHWKAACAWTGSATPPCSMVSRFLPKASSLPQRMGISFTCLSSAPGTGLFLSLTLCGWPCSGCWWYENDHWQLRLWYLHDQPFGGVLLPPARPLDRLPDACQRWLKLLVYIDRNKRINPCGNIEAGHRTHQLIHLVALQGFVACGK